MTELPRRRFATALVLTALAPRALAAPVPVTDDRGKVLHLRSHARRIVALSPHLAELAFDAGAGSALIATVRGSDYPAEVQRLPVIGDAAGLDLERIVMLRPDLVLGWQSGNRAADIERLAALGLPIFVSESRRLADVPATLRRLGALAGTEATAERAARVFEARLARLTPQPRPPVSVFVEIWHRPLMTVNGTHLISEVLATCGGHNVFDGMPALSGSVAMESVLGADPQVIIAATPPGLDVLADWRALTRLRAVQTGRVHAIDPNLLTRATPRILDGLEQVCAWLGT